MDHKIIIALSACVLAFGEVSPQFIIGAGSDVSLYLYIVGFYQNIWLESLFMKTMQDYDNNAMSLCFKKVFAS